MRSIAPLMLGLVLAAVWSAAASADAGVDSGAFAPVTQVRDTAVAPVGDVNGDGVGDIGFGPFEEEATGFPCQPPAENSEADYPYQDVAQVVFGPPPPGLGVGATGAPGVRIRCVSEPQLDDDEPPPSRINHGRSTGGAIAGVGDLDGDGLADVAIGAAGAGPRGRPVAGSVHIVFGGPQPRELDARSTGDQGARIDGPERASELGRVVVPAGDVDGDGRSDIAVAYSVGVAAPDGRRLHRDEIRIAVVSGAAVRRGEQLDLAALGGASSTFTGLQIDDEPGSIALTGAGDVDGDGRDDLVLGLPRRHGGLGDRGRVLVLRVPPFGSTIDLRRHTPIMRVDGGFGEFLGTAVAAAGDVDGDGRPDLAVASTIPPGVFAATGPPHERLRILPVLPGTVLDLEDPPAGLRSVHAPASDSGRFGASIAPLGDVTGDGRPDLLVGAPQASPDCRASAGAAWVVPGGPAVDEGAVDLLPGAWRIDGAVPGARLGEQVTAADLTADGVPDLVLPALPFYNAAALDVRVLPASLRPGVVAPVPRPDRCLRVRAIRPLRSARRGRVVLDVRSDVGTGIRHAVALTVTAVPLQRRPRTRAEYIRIVIGTDDHPTFHARPRFAGPGRRRVVVRLPAAVRRRLAGTPVVLLSVLAEQEQPDGQGTGFERFYGGRRKRT